MSDDSNEFQSIGDQPTAAYDAIEDVSPELAAEQRSVALKPGEILNQRFEILSQLGFGGMGAVYKVRDRDLNEDRALKVMLPSLLKSDKARERFLEEIKISQKLSHDGIVRVHDLVQDRDRGVQFFTMELVGGTTLGRKMAEAGGKLPVNEAVGIMNQLCDALAYAHKLTIHRDLKPQNIMVQTDGAVKILDFGLAKLMSPGRLNKSSMALGTAYYQSPEQSVHLTELDQRADIYSLGVILYQMLTGEIPVGMIAPASQLNPKVPKHIDAIIAKCLSPKADGRYNSVEEMRAAFRETKKVDNGKSKAFVPVLIGASLAIAGTIIGVVIMMAGSEDPEYYIGEYDTPDQDDFREYPPPQPDPIDTAEIERLAQLDRERLAQEETIRAKKEVLPLPEPKPEPEIDAQYIIDQYVTAVGGRNKIEAVRNVVMRGQFIMREMGATANVESYQSGNNYKHTMFMNGVGSVTQGITDGTVWELNPMEGDRILSGPEADEVRRTADINPFMNWRTHFASATLAGEMQGDYKVVFGPKDSFGMDTIAYFDIQTGLLDKIESYVDGIYSVATLSGYRDIDGLKFAFNGEITADYKMEVKYESVQLDVDLNPAVFAMPPYLQEQAWEQGVTVQQVMEMLDLNGDGKITLSESPEELRASFSEFDLNGDRSIDLSEAVLLAEALNSQY